jgi:hypothetical protein
MLHEINAGEVQKNLLRWISAALGKFAASQSAH